MLKTIGKFEVKRLEILDVDGGVDGKLMPKLSSKEIKELYEYMVLTRVFDDKALKLQRQGKMGTYASSLGQEASVIGSAYALDKEDWVFPSFRENGVYILRGYPLDRLYQFWGGDERGMNIPKEINMFTVSVPVGTHLLHAVGAAYAFKYKKKKSVSVAYFGDGATSEGDFHEAMNFSGVLKLPIVFICQNNQWAISVPREKQTASKTIAQKAIAYGFEGIQVDGNDIFAVYKATKEALEKARKNIPTLIECETYRMSDHTTADDASRYRTSKELEEWRKKDPIVRLVKYMQKKKLWDQKYGKQVQSKCEKLVEEAVKKYEKIKPQDKEEIFNYTYGKLTDELEDEMKGEW